MKSPTFHVPEPVRLRAASKGEAGEAWLARLPTLVAELSAAWDLSLGGPLPGGTEACVLAATTPDGRDAVLKIAPPWRDAASRELDALRLARGRGYAEVHRHDRTRRAKLLERLGPRLADLGWSPDAQARAICGTLARAWRPAEEGRGFMTGAEKAESLGRFIEEAWPELDRPCPRRTVEAALRCADDRRRAADRAPAVLGHGDPHPWNTLRTAERGRIGFKFIDPDGLLIEPAYDLGVLMREWTSELLAGDPLALGRRRCRRLSELTRVEPGPIWRWGLIERVSTGLLCLQIGLEEGRDTLAVADAWAAAPL